MAQPKTSQSEFDAKIAVVSDIDWARFAAYLDSEGCIFIGRTNIHKGTKMPQFVLTLVIGNTDLRLIRWLSETFSGEHYIIPDNKLSKKIGYSWRVHEKRAAILLEHCMRYMICKRDQAEIALAYRALRDQGSKGRKLTLVDVQGRDELRNKLCTLNRPKILENSQETA